MNIINNRKKWKDKSPLQKGFPKNRRFLGLERYEPSASYKKRSKFATLLIALLLVIVFIPIGYLIYASYHAFANLHLFDLRYINIKGNIHISKEDIFNLVKVKEGDDLWRLSLKEKQKSLLSSPWVMDASLSRILPDRLEITIKEREPLTFIDSNGNLYLADSEGVILKQLQEKSIFSLPVIIGVNSGKLREGVQLDSKGALEAIGLIKTIKTMGIIGDITSLDEVSVNAENPENIILYLNGVEIRIGIGNYSRKLEKLKDIESEIKNKGLIASYIDLRFPGKVIIRPLSDQTESIPRKGRHRKIVKDSNIIGEYRNG